MDDKNTRIGIVGACGSGKSELARRLKARGFSVRHIAQEHSFAPNMWQHITNPDILIFLEVSYPVTMTRKHFNWTVQEYQQQLERLAHAHQHADLHIDTDVLTPDEVLVRVLNFLE